MLVYDKSIKKRLIRSILAFLLLLWPVGQRRGGRAFNPGRVQPGPPFHSRPAKPFHHQPIDREKTCPLFLRVFTKVKEVAPEANKKDATLSFAFVYPCKTGRLLVRKVGRIFSHPDPRRPDNGIMSLRDFDFEIGDYLDVAIL
ncbi:Sin3 associated polypeptide p [Heracleum sosnowskyi]|uniref:Sin3 associated polypeptide p n=1 Tax=Heracleum sosnowskyi TaxID=360622 RepID=A0AAD8MLX8_9APIA|nr:Sin3 associated polypeptide p [Heracleum sosnowskyi]